MIMMLHDFTSYHIHMKAIIRISYEEIFIQVITYMFLKGAVRILHSPDWGLYLTKITRTCCSRHTLQVL